MKQPQLSEYGLTDENIQIYETQLKKYNDIIKYVSEKTKKRNSFVIKICLIPTVIFFITFNVVNLSLENSGESSIINAVVFYLVIILYPTIIAKFFYIKKEDLSEFEKKKKKKFENDLGYKNSRYDYIDKELEEKVIAFNLASEKYKNATDKTRLAYWMQLTHRQFEIEVANLYSLLGYSTTVTKASGDGGVDVIIKKNGEKIGIQCKHHAKPVGPNDFRALTGVIASQNYDYGIFVSLNGFTSTVFDEAKKSLVKVELVSSRELVSLAQKIK